MERGRLSKDSPLGIHENPPQLSARMTATMREASDSLGEKDFEKRIVIIGGRTTPHSS